MRLEPGPKGHAYTSILSYVDTHVARRSGRRWLSPTLAPKLPAGLTEDLRPSEWPRSAGPGSRRGLAASA